MIFNSIAFLFFLPIVFFLYWFLLNKNLKTQNLLLLISSYFFYGWWSWKFMGLLILSTLLDFAYGFWVASTNRRKAKFFLWLSIINNLGILAIFKYYNFFASQISVGLSLLNINFNPHLLNLVLPIGISFYTFHGMSYVFDIYRGNQKPVRNFEEYAVFVSFFPLLVAGPIERANHLLPQVQKSRIFNYRQSVQGIYLIIWGLFKKVVIADNLGSLVDIVFNNPNEHSTVSLIFAAIGFSFQIYCDFSGYSDIASGVAKLFGFELLKNFDFPYWSKSIPEFWKKWHISLSSWFRDYVYFPLGGSRVGIFKAVRNVFIVFVLSAFWHGANWTFLVWGIIHALFYIPGFVNIKINKTEKKPQFGIAKYLSILGTFVVVTIAWVFFRSESISKAIDFFREFNQLTMGVSFIKTNTHMVLFIKAIIGLLILLIFEFYSVNRSRVFSRRFFAIIVLCILLLGSFKDSMSFIYFQF